MTIHVADTDALQEMGRRLVRDRLGIETIPYRCETFAQFQPHGVEITVYYRMTKYSPKRRIDAMAEVSKVAEREASGSGPLVNLSA